MTWTSAPHPRDALVEEVPHERDVAAGPEHAGDLRQRHLVVEPVERLRHDHDVDAAVVGGDLLGAATLALTSGTRSCSTASIAGSFSVAKTAWPWSTISRVSLPVPAPSSSTTLRLAVEQPGHGLGGVGRPAAVVGVGDGTEGPRQVGGGGALGVLVAHRVKATSGAADRSATSLRTTTVLPVTDPLAWLVDLEGVPLGVRRTRDGIDVMLRDRGLRRTSPEMTAESLLRGAHATAVLEGSASTLERGPDGRDDEIATDAVRLSASMLALAPLLKTAPLQAIARLHAVVGSGALGAEAAGPARATRRPPTGCAGWRSCCCPATDGAGPARRRESPTPTSRPPRPSPPTTGSWPGPSSGWCSSRAGSTPSRSSCPRPGTWPSARSTSPTCAPTATAGRAGVHAWVLYGAEAFVRRGRGVAAAAPGGVRRAKAMRAAPAREDRMPSLTRDVVATKRALLTAALGNIPND